MCAETLPLSLSVSLCVSLSLSPSLSLCVCVCVCRYQRMRFFRVEHDFKAEEEEELSVVKGEVLASEGEDCCVFLAHPLSTRATETHSRTWTPSAHAHTHTHTYIYKYVYIHIVTTTHCVSVQQERCGRREEWRECVWQSFERCVLLPCALCSHARVPIHEHHVCLLHAMALMYPCWMRRDCFVVPRASPLLKAFVYRYIDTCVCVCRSVF